MKYLIPRAFIIFLSISIVACTEPKDPNLDKTGHNILEEKEIADDIDLENLKYHDLLYVPIYSDIYIGTSNQNELLAATLSIRNTSLTDSLIVSKIDYYNTDGHLTKQFLEHPIAVGKMGTVNYVIEREDTSGGAGANFIVELSSKSSKVRPVVQAIMVRNKNNRSFSFMTEAYSIK